MQKMISTGCQTTSSPGALWVGMPRRDEVKQLLLEDVIAATERRRPSGDEVLMVPERFATPVDCTTPS